MIQIAGITPESTVDGPGIRFTIFMQGCQHNCPGCHNPQTHEVGAGKTELIGRIIDKLKQYPIVQGVTISGGEPFLQPIALALLINEIVKYDPKLNIMVYTGFTWEELMTDPLGKGVFKQIDLLIDGPFIQEKADLSLLYKGSTNQRVIDVPKTLKAGYIVRAALPDYID